MKNLHAINTSQIKGWLTSYGALIPFGELSDDHIKNIIRMFSLRSSNTMRAKMIAGVIQESQSRGLYEELARDR